MLIEIERAQRLIMPKKKKGNIKYIHFLLFTPTFHEEKRIANEAFKRGNISFVFAVP